MKPKTLAALLLPCFVLVSAPAPAANVVIGPSGCNEAGLDSALASVQSSGGGTITFNCGNATIPFTGYKQVSGTVAIDGGDVIVFDGGASSAFFQVFASGTLSLRRLTLQHGRFSGSHALENFGFLRLDRVRMQANVSNGPTIQNQGGLIIERSTFSGNSNTDVELAGCGGVLYNDGGEATVRTSTFVGNQAGTGGSAICSTSDLDIADSTFTGNATTEKASGSAIYMTGGTGRVRYATIVGNTGHAYGGGIYSADPAVLTISRSIIAYNEGGNCNGSSTALVSGGYNVWAGATMCSFIGPGDGTGDPMLGALANNGGPTQTMLPASGSAAVDRIPGPECELPLDQRGAVRPEGPMLPSSGLCDSGAVERSSTIDVIFYDSFD